MRTYTLPDDLRMELEDALGGVSIKSKLTTQELTELIQKIPASHAELKKRLLQMTLKAEAGGEVAKSRMAAKTASGLGASVGTRVDEKGRRRLNRRFWSSFLTLAAILLGVGVGIWGITNSIKLPASNRPANQVEQPPRVQPQPEPSVSNPTPEAEPVPLPGANGASPSAQEAMPPVLEPNVAMPPLDEGLDAAGGSAPGPELVGGGARTAPMASGAGGSLREMAGGTGLSTRQRGGGEVAAKAYAGGGGTLREGLPGGQGEMLASLGGGGALAKTTETPAQPRVNANPSQPPIAAPRASSATSTKIVAPTPRLTSALKAKAASELEDLRPGALIPAKVEAGVVLATGLREAPVTAKDEKGRIWMGVARLAGVSGRVLLLFDELVVGNDVYSVQATGLSTDKTYGLPVEVKDVAPSLAASMIRASISGISSYVQGLESQKRVYHDAQGNIVEETGQAPSLELQVARRVAEIFNLPIDQKVVDRVYLLKTGAKLYVLVRKAPR